MCHQKIKSKATTECCDRCGKFSYQRIIIGRLDLFHQTQGVIIPADLFNSKLCRKCFTLVIQKTFDELQIPTEKRADKAAQTKSKST